jgi:hypothetical protein
MLEKTRRRGRTLAAAECFPAEYRAASSVDGGEQWR